jgi:23S rRNA pseudouridine955/2504/2580 synthase
MGDGTTLEPGPGVRHLTVQQDAGQRIDNYLLRELKGLPRSRIYRMLRKGEVRVNGGRVKPTHRLAPGDRVRIPPLRGLTGAATGGAAAEGHAAFIGPAIGETLARAVVHEDAELLVLNKPAGMPVHGGSGLSFGVIEALRHLRPDEDLALGHRLDRDTSGCLLIAKSRRMLLELHRALRDREVKKDYAVLVSGTWPRRTTTVRLPLQRYVTASGERRVRVAADGKASRTDFEIREVTETGQASRLRARLHTGRTHQIRVHTQAVGHGVIGDEKYASAEELAWSRSLGISRLGLHAEELVLQLDGRKRRFHASPPEDFQRAWQALASGV